MVCSELMANDSGHEQCAFAIRHPVYTHIRIHTYTRHSRSENRVYAKLTFEFPAISLLLQRGKGVRLKGCEGKAAFFSPFIRFFRSSIVSNWQFHYTLDSLSTLNDNVKEGGGWNENRCDFDFGEFCFCVDA